MRRRLAMAAMLAGLAWLGTGCVERTITVTSEPEGALVHLNDEPIGRTPVRVPFTYYGVYDVRLDLAGYEPLWTRQKADAPWWEFPGPDLVGEAIPGNAVGLAWHYELTPQVPVDDVDPDALAERAAEMAKRVRGKDGDAIEADADAGESDSGPIGDE